MEHLSLNSWMFCIAENSVSGAPEDGSAQGRRQAEEETEWEHVRPKPMGWKSRFHG
jgi:hypothetical protein